MRRRQIHSAVGVLGAFAVLVAVAAGPGDGDRAVAADGAPAAAPQVLPGEPQPLGMPFLPTPNPMHVTIASLNAVGLSVKNNVTVRLSDGTTRTTTQYTFTQLAIRSNMQVSHTAPDGTALTISVPGTGSLGGLDRTGKPETTVMWGDIGNLCVTVLFEICGIQGLLNFFGSIIKLDAGATRFSADIYGIQTIDDHAALDSTDNPVHLPGTITVTSP